MKRIAIGLITALLVLTNSGYAQNLDSMESRTLKSNEAIQRLINKKLIDGKTTLSHINKLNEKNNKIDLRKTAQGGVDSGGSTLISTTHATGLLDLYLYNLEAFLSRDRGEHLPNTRSYNDFGFDSIANADSPIIQKTFAQIAKWQESSPVITDFVSRALKALPIFYVKAKFTFKDQTVFIPPGFSIPSDSIDLGAYYMKDIGVFVEKETFDKLSLQNQMALLIHEALRHQQISLASGMTNEIVHKLTAQLMKNPTPGFSLDIPTYLQGPLLRNILEEATSLIVGKDVADKICIRFPKHCGLMSKRKYPAAEFAEAAQTVRLYILAHRDMPDAELIELSRLSKYADAVAQQLGLASFNENTAFFQEANFELRGVLNMNIVAQIARKYNDSGGTDSAEAEALRFLVENLKKMGMLAD